MSTAIRYGTAGRLNLDLPEGTHLIACEAPRGEPLGDVAAATADALAAPSGFPPLFQAVAPEDRVVIAIGGEVPRLDEILVPLVEVLLRRGVSAHDIALLRDPGEAESTQDDPRGRLPESIAQAISLVEHDPETDQELAYLTVTEDGTTVYLNRRLVDADLVIMVGCLHSEDGRFATHASRVLYPRFSNLKARQQGKSLSAQSLQGISTEVAWLMGAQFGVLVLPGSGDAVLEVMAGELNVLSKEGDRHWRDAWSFTLEEPAELVIAAIEGGTDQPAKAQTWQQLGRALQVAQRLVTEGGAIALCCDTAQDPPLALRVLGEAEDYDHALQAMAEADMDQSDFPLARCMAAALRRASIYLLSPHDEEAIEELGLFHLADGADLSRLAGRFSSCIVLANAQRVAARIRRED
jgi:hypothetical protein